MIVPMAMCGALGWYLDEKLGTGFLFIMFLLLGIMAAFRNVYELTKSFYQKDMKREHEELAYIENLKKEGRRVRQDAEKRGQKK